MNPSEFEIGTVGVPDVLMPGDETAAAVEPEPEPEALRTTVAGAATLAAVVIGMTAAAVYRRGAFYPLDAFGVVVVSLFLVAAALRRCRDRVALTVTLMVGALAAWWLSRAVTTQSAVAFLPLGASLLGFLAAFLVIRHLGDDDRSRVVMAVVAVGALTAASGVAGVLWHWHPLVQHSDHYWQMATTLTYPAAAAVLLILALLVSLALDLHLRLVRAAVCLCLIGLIGTQSRWDLLALAAGALAIPPRRWRPALWPLAMGVAAGLAVVASAAGRAPTWLCGAAVVVAVLASTCTRRAGEAASGRWPAAQTAVGLVAVAGGVAVVMLFPLFGHAPRQPADQGQTLAWSASADAWRSSVLTGVGPPKITTSHSDVDTYPGMVPDGYLTITAEGGLIGALLLLGAGAVVAASFRRRDLASSVAAGAAVAFAVAGAVDFDWQLPALALLGGCVAGLASAPPREGANLPPDPAADPPADPAADPPADPAADPPSDPVADAAADPAADGANPPPDPPPELPPPGEKPRTWRRGGAGALWVVGVVVLIAAQLVVGSNQRAAGVTRATRAIQSAEPPPSTTLEAPGRIILAGDEDATDPYMLKIKDRYYLFTSEGTTFMNAPLWIGTKLGHWSSPIDVLPNLPGWAQGGLTWAPDVQKVAGGWALYFTALLRGVNPYTHCIGSAFARSPTGPFVPAAHPFICQLAHRGSIDARVFVEADGHLVMQWKSEDNANPSVPGPDQDGFTGIYAQDLSADGKTLLGTPVKIFSPSQPWEATIVEAPDMIEAWGTYWLFFSGNWYDSTAYAIGVAQCQSPFGPCTDPNPTPFLSSNLQGAGPGEESLFVDGSDVYLLYNPFKANDPHPIIPRPVSMTRLGFTPAGPYLASP
jgi:GH43 family beta-xylosidase